MPPEYLSTVRLRILNEVRKLKHQREGIGVAEQILSCQSLMREQKTNARRSIKAASKFDTFLGL